MGNNKNKLGLTLGIFAALLHLVWAVLVAIGIAQNWLNWIFPMHFIDSVFSVTSFSIVNALILIVLAFIGGYACGWVLGAIWNYVDKE